MTDPIEQWLAGEVAAGFASVLESMTDERPRVSFAPAGAPASNDWFWWRQPFSVDPGALLWIGAPRETWMELGGRALRAAGIDAAEAGEARDTYVEILGQVLSGLAQTMGARAEREVVCGKGSGDPGAPSATDWFSLEVNYPGAAPAALLATWSAALVPAIENRGAAAEAARGPLALREGAAGAPEAPASKTLDLLLEVEMPVSISFGRAELPLKDVLKLTTGSIVELNRSVSEPVEVIVNNCVVARGEVVVMDGNYGVKIHCIVSPRERLRTLK